MLDASPLTPFRQTLALLLVGVAVNGCACAGEQCLETDASRPAVRGRILTSHHYEGGTTDRDLAYFGLKGAMVRLLGQSIVKETDSSGCFAIPVFDIGPYVVEVAMPSGDFLGAMRIGMIRKGDGLVQIPEIATLKLGPTSIIIVPAPDELAGSEFFAQQEVSGRYHFRDSAIAGPGSAAVLSNLGPGKYRLIARTPTGDTIYYPGTRAAAEAKAIELGIEAKVVVNWKGVSNLAP